MPGDIIGFSCSCEIIVSSPSPLSKESAASPAAIAKALEAQLGKVRFSVAGERSAHRVAEAHVYRIAPTLTAVRAALGQPTPWTRGRPRRTARRGRGA